MVNLTDRDDRSDNIEFGRGFVVDPLVRESMMLVEQDFEVLESNDKRESDYKSAEVFTNSKQESTKSF